MLLRKIAGSVAVFLALTAVPAGAETVGVSESEIKVGATFPFSGPASPLSNTGKGLIAYVNSVNDRGGINGRKINLVTYKHNVLPLDDRFGPRFAENAARFHGARSQPCRIQVHHQEKHCVLNE